jgi:hypothetical protein
MRINIVGGGFGKGLAPHNETVWSFNDCLLTQPASVVFDMHNLPEVLAGRQKLKRRTIEQVQAGLDKIRETKTPMYSLEEWEGAKRYPIEKIVEEFKTDYFTCGVAYAIALAIYQGVKELHLYGISLGLAHEYSFEKPCVEFWIGIAKGRGVEVGIFGESEVLRSSTRTLYGYNIKQGE